MNDDEILQLASETSGAHSFDRAHVLRFARAVIAKVGAPSPCHHIRSSGTGQWATNWCALAEQPADHREAMRQALEALEYINANCVILADHEGPLERAIPALRKALGE
jgi:hypothetical protein